MVAQSSSDDLLAEFFRGFPQPYDKCHEICEQLKVSSHHYPYHYLKDVIDVTLTASDLWLETRTGAGGTATLA